MRLSRRSCLKGLGATGLVAALPLPPTRMARAAAVTVLEAKPGTAQLLEPPGGITDIWGYAGVTPGPVLRVKQGEEVWVRLENKLPQPTTIHWHGIRIDNDMDGVPHLTQHAVEPDGSFDYRFVAPDAGTFWYHPHDNSWEQVARGLYGVLIVEEPDPPDADRDTVVVAADWRLEDSGALHEASFGSLHDSAHAGRLGNELTLNAHAFAEFPVVAGERVRVRLLNACNARILDLRFEDVLCHLVALDGQPVPPRPLEDGRVRIAPAQRADLMIDMTGAPGDRPAITEISSERVEAGRFVYHASDSRPLRHAPPAALTDNGLPEPDLHKAERVDLVMAGGAMGRLSTAIYRGQEYELRDLAREHGQVWAFNDVAGMPDAPLFSVPRGTSVAIRMVNETRWPHGMHIHGHHYREIGPGAPRPSPWLDTALLEAMETRSYAFVADNPGKWMLHCHMLEHQASGMKTWFEVT